MYKYMFMWKSKIYHRHKVFSLHAGDFKESLRQQFLLSARAVPTCTTIHAPMYEVCVYPLPPPSIKSFAGWKLLCLLLLPAPFLLPSFLPRWCISLIFFSSSPPPPLLEKIQFCLAVVFHPSPPPDFVRLGSLEWSRARYCLPPIIWE